MAEEIMSDKVEKLESHKTAAKFLKESQAGRFIVITDGDEIGAFVAGDMTKAELIGMLEIAKLMIADQV
jgi:hypothetical protein